MSAPTVFAAAYMYMQGSHSCSTGCRNIYNPHTTSTMLWKRWAVEATQIAQIYYFSHFGLFINGYHLSPVPGGFSVDSTCNMHHGPHFDQSHYVL